MWRESSSITLSGRLLIKTRHDTRAFQVSPFQSLKSGTLFLLINTRTPLWSKELRACDLFFFNQQIARVRRRESNSALLNLAIYAVFVFTPTAIMAQLNNLAVVCKWRWPNINCKFKVLQIIRACSLCFTLPAWCEYAQFVLVRFWASFFFRPFLLT